MHYEILRIDQIGKVNLGRLYLWATEDLCMSAVIKEENNQFYQKKVGLNIMQMIILSQAVATEMSKLRGICACTRVSTLK